MAIGVVVDNEGPIPHGRQHFRDLVLQPLQLHRTFTRVQPVDLCILRVDLGQHRRDRRQPGPRVRGVQPGVRVLCAMAVTVIVAPEHRRLAHRPMLCPFDLQQSSDPPAAKAPHRALQPRRQRRPDPEDGIRVLKGRGLGRAQGIAMRGRVRRQQDTGLSDALHHTRNQ